LCVFAISRFKAALLISLAALLLASGAAFAAASDVPGNGRFTHSFGPESFAVTRDAVKLEAPQDGMFKVAPRNRNNVVWTRFQLPDTAWRHREWSVTALVNSSSSAGGGVGAWYDDGGYVLLLFPDGQGFMRYYEGKSVAWSAEVKVANFAWPARLSLARDVNGSIIGRVNDAVIGARLVPVDLKRRALPMVKSVSFVTQATSGSGSGYALYERLDVEAWDAR
jgi:hypothetical protein